MMFLKKSGINMLKLPHIPRITYLKNNIKENKMDSTRHGGKVVFNSNIDVRVGNSTTATEKLYEELKKILAGAKLTASNLTVILVNLMQIVETYPKLTGPQKKEVILSSINMLIDDQNDNVEDAKTLKFVVAMTLPNLIDTLVKIDRKKIGIKLQKMSGSIFALCCGGKSIET